MSIYASIDGVDDEEPVGAPWIYQGSHILPAEDDPRGGNIGLALIPSHITRDGRDDQPEDGTPWPWLRLSVYTDNDDPTVILSPAQARHLAERLNRWADSASSDPQKQPTPDPPGSRSEQLPADVLALLRPRGYLSTACDAARRVDIATIQHPDNADLPAWVERLHARCRLNNKYTGERCHCRCHTPA